MTGFGPSSGETATGSELTVILSRENLHEEPPALREALRQTGFGSGVQLIDGDGAVSAIGAGINTSYRHVLAGTDALQRVGITPHGTATSSFRITWLVPQAQLHDSVRTLHQHFLE